VWRKFKRLVFGRRQRVEQVEQVIVDGTVIAEGWKEVAIPFPIYLKKGEPFEVKYEGDPDEGME